MDDIKNAKWYDYVAEALDDFHLDMVDKTHISHEDMRDMMINILKEMQF